MLSYGNKICIILSFEQSEKHIDFVITKISSRRSLHIDKRKMKWSRTKLREESIECAIAVSDICDNIKGCSVYINQLLRSSSSIGANIHEAKYAQSRSDFIHKLEIALKESSKTDYWLELIYRKNKFGEETYKE